MHDFMLQCMPFHGPVAQGPLNDPKGQEVWDVDPAQYIKNFEGNVVAPFYTHGIDVANMVTDYVWGWQLRLIHCITRCLADRPRDRPTLYELLRHVEWIEVSVSVPCCGSL